MLALGPLATLPLASGPFEALFPSAIILTSVSATGAVGDVIVSAPVTLTAVSTTGEVGDPTVYINISVLLSGVSATTALGNVLVWGVIQPGADAGWAVTGAGANANWAVILTT